MKVPRVPRWAAAVFVGALLARLAFLFLADQPLLYSHQYTYFTNGLRIAEHAAPLRYVLTSDEWRTWDGHWTIAPLYHLFLAVVFGLGGPHLLLLRLLQCVLDAGAAVAVASLGRRAAGPRGVWAGVVYALYWPALEMPTWTMTENLHTPLFTTALAVLAREAAEPSRGRAFLGGALIGLSALARSVSSGFVAVAALWRLWSGGRRSWPTAALVAAGGAAVILPWTARNVFLAGDAVLIESAAFENIWWANHFTDRQRYLRQEEVVHGQPTPAAKRAAALHFAVRGIRRSPGEFVQKVRTNFWHFVRPEGLQNLFGVERSLEPWRHAGTLLLDDLPLLLAIPFFAAFLAAGRPSPARGLIALWSAYYLFMVVVVFHNEIRYRSAFVPFLFAGAVAGIRPPGPGEARRRILHWVALALGAAISLTALWPYRWHVWGGLAAIPATRRAEAAAQRGDVAAANAYATDAAARNPRSARPWFDLGKALLGAGRPVEAAEAYERMAGRANFANWRPVLGLHAARHFTGPPEDEARLLQRLDRTSWDMDPWLLLEAGWREVPPPRTDEVLLARGDYGAVRGFLHPRGLDPRLNAHRREWNRYDLMGGPQPPAGAHRWSRRHAWVRLVPTQAAAAHEVSVEMGAPFPSTLRSPEVTVRVGREAPQRVVLDATIKPYRFRVASEPGRPILVALTTPTWSRAGEPADQGVRVDRVVVRPLE